MRSSCFLQLMPTRNRDDKVTGFKISGVTQSLPRTPLGGSYIARLVIDVDEAVFAVPEMLVRVTAEGVEGSAMFVPVIEQAVGDDDDPGIRERG